MKLTKKNFEKQARPLAKQLIDYATAKGKQYGITDVKVSISCGAEEDNSIENGQISESVSGTSWGVGVTLYAGDRSLGFGKNTLDTATLFEAIEQNMKVIHLVPENADKNLLDSDKVYKGPVADLDLVDQKPPSQTKLINYAKKMEKAAFAVSGVKTARSSNISSNQGYSLLVATNGLDQLTCGTYYQASISAIAEDKNGMEISSSHSLARHFNDMAAPEDVGRQAGKKAVAKLGSTLPDSKQTTIILSQSAAATFFSSVLSAIDGTAVYRGSTFMKDKIGQQVMSSEITIEDDPKIERGIYSKTADSSGMEAKKITFIKDGILQCFNVSLTEARKLGIDPIGRNDGTTNVRIMPGQKSKDELVADIQDGFYIEGFQGGSANVNNGNFSRQAYGTLIENGKITDKAVSGFVVSGNLKDMFMKVIIANDTPDLPNPQRTMAVPTARIDGIKIAGK